MKKIISSVLAMVMVISLFNFDFCILTSRAASSEEAVLLSTATQKAISTAVDVGEIDKKTVKNNKYSLKIAYAELDGFSVAGVPSDISEYNELKICVYATEATTAMVMVNTDNPATEGADYRSLKLKLTEGWQDFSIELAKMGTSREPSYKNVSDVSFNFSGWGQKKNENVVLYFDSIVLSKNSEYLESTAATPTPTPKPAPTPTPTPKPEEEAGNTRYFEADYENGKGKGNHKDNKNSVAGDENKYLLMEKTGTLDMHLDTEVKNSGRYVVISADFASTNIPSGQIFTFKSAASQLTFVSLGTDGKIMANGIEIGTLSSDGSWTNVAVACDFDNAVYDVYINGEKKTDGINVLSRFNGRLTLYRIFINAGNAAGTNLMVDNIKIFDGKSPEDYKNTVSADAAYEQMIGKSSPIIEDGSAMIAYLDSAGGVAMNVRSGYIYANGKKSLPDAPAYIKDSRTLLPVRAVSEALGCSVSWDETSRTVTINENTKIVIDSDKMTLPNGSEYTLDVPAEITNGRTFIPLRALCEQALGKKVFWDDRGLIILTDTEISPAAENIEAINNFLIYDRPQAEDLKAIIAQKGNVHPRIIINKSRLDEIILSVQTNEYMKKLSENVIGYADDLIETNHVWYWIPDGLRLLETSRTMLRKSMNLSMAYHLTGDMKYVNYLWEDICLAGNFSDWNHKRHYLDVGEMTAAFAISYDWLYDVWTPEQKEFMEKAIVKHGLTPTQKALYGQCDYPHFFVTANTNWNIVCNGGTGMGAMAIFEKYPELCSDILEKNYLSIEAMMNEFYPDGAWYEGATYWDYLMQYLSLFISSSENTFGTDFNICSAPGFEKTGAWYLNMDGVAGSNNYHDAKVAKLYTMHSFFLADKIGQPDIASIGAYKIDKYATDNDIESKSIYSLVFYDTNTALSDGNITYPLDSYYSGTELINMRSSWTDDNGNYVSFHSGQNSVNHGHMDMGTFVVDLGGQRFAGDIGNNSYDDPGYFDTDRYKFYRARPEGHNCFVINPDGETNGQYLSASDRIEKFVSKPRGAYAITTLSSAYMPYASSARRGIMLGDDRRSVLIRDEIRGMKKDENEVYWFMQMEDVDVQYWSENSVILTKQGTTTKVKLEVLSDAAETKIEVGKAECLPVSDTVEVQSANTDWKRLAIIFKAGADLNINVKMSLLSEEAGISPISDVSLDEWTIPDGEIAVIEKKQLPVLEGISVNSNPIKDFTSDVAYYEYLLPYGYEGTPEVAVSCGEAYSYSIKMPDTLPGIAEITVTDNNNTALANAYHVYMRVRNETEITVSDYQKGNPGENSLDNDLETRWAVEGEAWAVYDFAEPKAISTVGLATWKSAERKLIFDIEVSTDGENFKKVWSGQSSIDTDTIESFDIPDGTYKAVKLVLYGTTTGTWNSILEVEFK